MGGPGGGGGDFGGIDFSKLGGGGDGMPDLGSLGQRVNPGDIPGYDEDDEDDEDDDDDLPALEGDDKKAAEAPKKA